MESVPTLVARSDGLYDFQADTIQDHIAVWRTVDSGLDSSRWAMAAVAASLTGKYKEEQVKEFARSVDYSAGYVWKIARAHKFYTDKQKCPSGIVEGMSFSHHIRALSHPDPIEALHHAKANGLPAPVLEEWITSEARKKATGPQKAAHRKRQNDFREFLERVDKVILTNFMETCPNAEWGRRVFKSWRDDITWELGQIARTEVADRVSEALSEGAVTVPDIKAKTGLTVKEIDGVVAWKVAE